jgi:hypothetical protein
VHAFREKGQEATLTFSRASRIGISNTISGPKVMSYITQQISEKKQLVAEIIEDAIFFLFICHNTKITNNYEYKIRRRGADQIPDDFLHALLWVLMIPHEFGRATCPLVSVFPNKIIYSNHHSLERFPS